MATLKFECKRTKSNSKGKSIIYLRINQGKTRAWISTKISIRPDRWNHKAQAIRKFKNRRENSDELNANLVEFMSKALEVIKTLPEHEQKTASGIKKEILSKTDPAGKGEYPADEGGVNLLHYGRHKNAEIKHTSYGYYKRRKTVLKHLSEYTGSEGIWFKEIDVRWVQGFYNHLLDIGQSANSARKTVKTCGTFFNAAIKEERTTTRNPFGLVRLKTETTRKQKLSPEEFESIRRMDLPQGRLIWHVRNIFCAQVYMAGMRISDLCVLQKKDDTGGHIEYRMRKTNRWRTILVTPPLRKILDYYHRAEPDNPNMFPLLDHPARGEYTNIDLTNAISSKTALCNKYLKKIQGEAGISKPLSTHIARHTFADLARRGGWSIYDISKALGHSSVKITERYLAELDQDSLDKGMRGLFGGL